MATTITFKQFIEPWKGVNPSSLGSKFSVNVLEFTIKAGVYSKLKFLNNIWQGSFFGQKWPQRKQNRWLRRFPHQPLTDTGKLVSSIRNSGKVVKGGKVVSNTQYYANRKTMNSYTYHIEANPKSESDPPKRGGRDRSRNMGYAAIHNAPSGTFTYGTNGPPSVQRQFIGHHQSLSGYINRVFVPHIMDGIPIKF